MTGLATALAVGAPWPVLALWWAADRGGYVTSARRRRLGGRGRGYAHLRGPLGSRPGPGRSVPRSPHDACAAYSRSSHAWAWSSLQASLPANRPTASARCPGTGRTPAPSRGRAGRWSAPNSKWSRAPPHPRGSPGPAPRRPALAQPAAGLPPATWALRYLSGGRLTSGALRPAHGALGLSHDLTHPRDRPPRPASATGLRDWPPRLASATGLRGRTRDWPRRPDPVAGPRDRPP